MFGMAGARHENADDCMYRGAAVRMAYAMGLHRDNVTHSTPGELGRRIWGSLIVLDAGEGLTLGRVSSVDVFKESRSNLMGSQPFVSLFKPFERVTLTSHH